MQSISQEEFSEVARLVEITSDAVALCGSDGTVLHVNNQLLELSLAAREAVVGADIRDLLYSVMFERAQGHQLPFGVDGEPVTLMLKLADGSFAPVRVRALKIGGSEFRPPRGAGLPEPPADLPAPPERLLVVMKSLEEQYASDRQQQRLLSELRAANRRLAGTLQIIMATVGTNDLAALVNTTLNRMVETLDAFGSTLYFTEGGGFKLRGTSESLAGAPVPDFIPYGAGVPTHVLRAGQACRLSVVRDGEGGDGSNVLFDLDSRTSHRLRAKDTPPFKTLIAVPVYFGTQMLGMVELGWNRPCMPREHDVGVLNVICEYLSIQLVGMVSSVRSARIAELERSLNRIRDVLSAHPGDHVVQWSEVAGELRRSLGCTVCPVLYDRARGVYVVDVEGAGRFELPGTVEEAFFSSTAPAARPRRTSRVEFRAAGEREASFGGAELEQGRLARVDRTMRVGRWLAARGLPSQGVFIDFGPDLVYWDERADGSLRADEDDPGTALVARKVFHPGRMLLLLRGAGQEPIDDIEFDYLTHLVRDVEVMASGARRHHHEQRIAQTLQAGMRSTLGAVPGITADALYSSATSQALVGGDFYTLIRMPEDRAVMILGDVSGKGVEAASMSALVKTALSAYAWEGADPASMAAALNSMLMSFSRPETFVSAFIASLDLRARRAVYCSAGHPPAMLVHPHEGAGEVELVSVQSGVMGAFEGMSYENGELALAPGDVLFMYTDGAIEARDGQGAFFGEDRLRDVVLHAASAGTEGLCQQVLEELDAFTGSALDDDIALVALRFDGVGAGPGPGAGADAAPDGGAREPAGGGEGAAHGR